MLSFARRPRGRISPAALAAASVIALAAWGQAPADVTPSGEVSNEDGTITWDWVYQTPSSSDPVAVGCHGPGALRIDDATNVNGVTRIDCESMYLGYG